MRDMNHNPSPWRAGANQFVPLALKRLASGSPIESLYRVLSETNRLPGVEIRSPHSQGFTKAIGVSMMRAREIKYISQFRGVAFHGLFERIYEETCRAGDTLPVTCDDCRVDVNSVGERFLVVAPNAVSEDLLTRARDDVREAVSSYLPRNKRKDVKWSRSAIDMTLAFAPSRLPPNTEKGLELAWGDIGEYIRENPIAVTLGPILDEHHYRAEMEARATG